MENMDSTDAGSCGTESEAIVREPIESSGNGLGAEQGPSDDNKIEMLEESEAAMRKRLEKDKERAAKVEQRRALLMKCDCLIPACPGCHYPCKVCRSPRCGHICKYNREWPHYLEIEVQGRDIIRKFSRDN